MSNKKNSTLWVGVLPPILIILVTGSLSLAILDKENRPAYFDIAKVAVGYAFGSMRLQGNSNDTEKSDNSN
ncbi:hypothetical protein [Fischerella thermalis]|uniref:Holin n=1 Tax=Fischerella thermalis JSC-11 TaxID=741277 RepID=G6FZT2_9CYAN|nr:hypothetical protein [Fischerella thermalis]PMB03106.1 hypothetical protein CEN49_24100 [Fischerella thermalis CCMEE 5273]PMB11894.1 hypothetical protein CI592_03075 [Fischerella thermalis CCMEE 5328]EHC08717.1 hypothetical protein FJSC11DRAFT_4381 [Fischerella thermalis JSC-11]MBF1991498.1 hypothetical protein [Fischerella thermalis M58_A2018_009]MBF2059738.1 hypothetical protein [Fischerella thermalis M66_A2018_004]